MRVLISVDMEGISGVVDGADVRPGEAEYERNRWLMTAEANAAIRGVFAYDPGAYVVVSDAHANFRNLLPEQLDRRARLLRGKPKAGGMVAGVDDDTDAVIFVGYHGRAGTPASVLSHTVSGAVIADVRCNGMQLGELGLNTAFVAELGAVPVLAVGDDTVAAEAASVAPGIHAVVVKHALGSGAAECLHPEEACERIAAAVGAALKDRRSVRPVQFSGPVTLEIETHHPGMGELALLIPGVERAEGCTLRYEAADFATAFRMVQLVAVLGQR